MLLNNYILFDSIIGQEVPCDDFGPIKQDDEALKESFFKVYEEVKCRIIEIFRVDWKDNREMVFEIEKIIAQMWDSGWDPLKHNIGLFSHDFGVILTFLLFTNFNGQFVFRSDNVLNHMSLIWVKKIEVFPFHKVFKRLSSKEGDSLIYYYNGIEKILI